MGMKEKFIHTIGTRGMFGQPVNKRWFLFTAINMSFHRRILVITLYIYYRDAYFSLPTNTSDRQICRTCPADFWWCPAEGSDPAGHFVQQGSIRIICPTKKTRMATDICQSSTGKTVWQGLKMSGRAPEIIFATTAIRNTQWVKY